MTAGTHLAAIAGHKNLHVVLKGDELFLHAAGRGGGGSKGRLHRREWDDREQKPKPHSRALCVALLPHPRSKASTRASGHAKQQQTLTEEAAISCSSGLLNDAGDVAVSTPAYSTIAFSSLGSRSSTSSACTSFGSAVLAMACLMTGTASTTAV